MRMKKVPPRYRQFTLLFSLLVFASTVLIKQHAAVDILGGILTAELGQQIAQRAAPRGRRAPIPFLRHGHSGESL